jgi:nucleoid DNA-binding protein
MTKIEMEKIVQDLVMNTEGVKVSKEKVVVTAGGAKEIVNGLFEAITDALCDGEEVSLPTIGKLKVGVKPAKKGTSFLNGIETKYDTPEGLKATFSQASAIKEALNA